MNTMFKCSLSTLSSCFCVSSSVLELITREITFILTRKLWTRTQCSSVHYQQCLCVSAFLEVFLTWTREKPKSNLARKLWTWTQCSSVQYQHCLRVSTFLEVFLTWTREKPQSNLARKLWTWTQCSSVHNQHCLRVLTFLKCSWLE